jgi:hypothetical protein
MTNTYRLIAERITDVEHDIRDNDQNLRATLAGIVDYARKNISEIDDGLHLSTSGAHLARLAAEAEGLMAKRMGMHREVKALQHLVGRAGALDDAFTAEAEDAHRMIENRKAEEAR